ncbi:hypothetical protein JVU11DRAFT_7945 [Chiua virens]|nr:hypothetical protein JVU11DRAFT_7945 [Chiua virens]
MDAHERSCAYNPATRVTHHTTPPDHPTLKSSLSSSSNEQKMMDRGSSTSVVTPLIESSSSSHSSSDSTLDDGEMFHSTSGISSSDVVGDGVRSHEPSTCLGSERTSSNTDKPLADGAEHVIPAGDYQQNHFSDCRDVIFRCAACLDSFSTEEAYLGHIQFEDEPLLQRHLEGSEAFSCQLCQTRCCSEEMKEDHLLSHPTCHKCGEFFADNQALCGHLESGHPVVVCWDCDGIVVETDSLGLHYTESPAHPSCVICGVGMRNSDAMNEQWEVATQMQAPKKNLPSKENEPLREDQNAAGLPSEQPDFVPPPPVMQSIVPLGGPCDGDNSPSRTRTSLFLSPQPPMPAQIEHISEPGEACVISGEQPLDRLDVDVRHYASPSPTPSEHGSDVSRMQVHTTGITNAAINNDIRASSSVSTVSADSSFSDTGRTTSSHSVVFVSADGIPDYIRENGAVLVATSAGSPSSGRTPLRLPSTSSLESLDMVQRIRRVQAQCEERSTSVGSAARPTHSLHCRICFKDPCEEMTATICGHVFCKRCITQAIVAKSECPVCKSATLLYCLFKLDLSG